MTAAFPSPSTTTGFSPTLGFRTAPVGLAPSIRTAAHPIDRVTGLLARHSITLLRISIGLVLLGFGALKFFPGVSPVEALVTRTVDVLSFGLLTGQAAMIGTAAVECLVGLLLVIGVFQRTAILLLGGCLLGFFSPLVLFFSELFPAGGPTLQAQYILKDVVLAAAALVVLTRALGAKFQR